MVRHHRDAGRSADTQSTRTKRTQSTTGTTRSNTRNTAAAAAAAAAAVRKTAYGPRQYESAVLPRVGVEDEAGGDEGADSMPRRFVGPHVQRTIAGGGGRYERRLYTDRNARAERQTGAASALPASAALATQGSGGASMAGTCGDHAHGGEEGEEDEGEEGRTAASRRVAPRVLLSQRFDDSDLGPRQQRGAENSGIGRAVGRGFASPAVRVPSTAARSATAPADTDASPSPIRQPLVCARLIICICAHKQTHRHRHIHTCVFLCALCVNARATRFFARSVTISSSGFALVPPSRLPFPPSVVSVFLTANGLV